MKTVFKGALYIFICMALLVLIPSFTAHGADPEAEWNGSGSNDDPYQIASVDDLIRFRDAVNDGKEYNDTYFMLVADLDLGNSGEWIPIGQYGSGSYFYGIFDGNGHKISNMTTIASGNNGFFGALGGTVMNLVITDATVSGSCCGIIASHAASSNALIINCYASGKVFGARTSGCVDNFNGSIVNCVSIVEGDTLYGITSYTANLVYNCFSNREMFGEKFTGENYRGAVIENDSWESVCENLNEFLIEGANYVQVDYTKLKKWEVDKNGEPVLGENIDCSDMWEGSGNSENPYVIASASDLIVLRDSVNAGEKYQDIWFMLADNIDLEFCGEWIPIGQYGGGNYFYGFFDGNGYEISNMTTISSGNNGLFGALGGTVMNLKLTDCDVSGACCGTIASHTASAAATIINCFSNGNVSASRSGGIADNFNGAIINCLTIIENENMYGMVSYSASLLYNCYSNNPLFSNNFTGANYNNRLITNEDLPEICDALNEGIIEGAGYAGVDFRKLRQWTVDENGMISFEDYISLEGDYYLSWIKAQKVYIGLILVIIIAGGCFIQKTKNTNIQTKKGRL